MGCKKIFVNENRKWILDRKYVFFHLPILPTYYIYVCCKIKNKNDWWLIWWSSQEKSEFMLCQGGLLFDCFSKLRISVSFLFKKCGGETSGLNDRMFKSIFLDSQMPKRVTTTWAAGWDVESVGSTKTLGISCRVRRQNW